MEEASVCMSFQKRGFCQFGDKCRFRHAGAPGMLKQDVTSMPPAFQSDPSPSQTQRVAYQRPVPLHEHQIAMPQPSGHQVPGQSPWQAHGQHGAPAENYRQPSLPQHQGLQLPFHQANDRQPPPLKPQGQQPPLAQPYDHQLPPPQPFGHQPLQPQPMQPSMRHQSPQNQPPPQLQTHHHPPQNHPPSQLQTPQPQPHGQQPPQNHPLSQFQTPQPQPHGQQPPQNHHLSQFQTPQPQPHGQQPPQNHPPSQLQTPQPHPHGQQPPQNHPPSQFQTPQPQPHGQQAPQNHPPSQFQTPQPQPHGQQPPQNHPPSQFQTPQPHPHGHQPPQNHPPSQFQTPQPQPHGPQPPQNHPSSQLQTPQPHPHGQQHPPPQGPLPSTPRHEPPHTQNLQSPEANFPAPVNQKTKKCKRFLLGGTCQYGARCNFAHNDEELAQGLAALEKLNVSQKEAQKERKERLGQTDSQGHPELDNLSHNPKSRLCKSVLLSKPCRWGENCSFSHSEEEIQALHPDLSLEEIRKRCSEETPLWMVRKKTRICNYYLEGKCPFEARCTFAHGEHELSLPGQGVGLTTPGNLPLPEAAHKKNSESRPPPQQRAIPCQYPQSQAPPRFPPQPANTPQRLSQPLPSAGPPTMSQQPRPRQPAPMLGQQFLSAPLVAPNKPPPETQQRPLAPQYQQPQALPKFASPRDKVPNGFTQPPPSAGPSAASPQPRPQQPAPMIGHAPLTAPRKVLQGFVPASTEKKPKKVRESKGIITFGKIECAQFKKYGKCLFRDRCGFKHTAKEEKQPSLPPPPASPPSTAPSLTPPPMAQAESKAPPFMKETKKPSAKDIAKAEENSLKEALRDPEVYRQVLVENLPVGMTEAVLKDFIGSAMMRVGLALDEENPIAEITLREGTKTAAVELRTEEETFYILHLDKIRYVGRPLHISRPKTFPGPHLPYGDWNQSLIDHRAGMLKAKVATGAAKVREILNAEDGEETLGDFRIGDRVKARYLSGGNFSEGVIIEDFMGEYTIKFDWGGTEKGIKKEDMQKLMEDKEESHEKTFRGDKGEWQEKTDPGSGQKYYYNSVTGVSQWENPNKIEKGDTGKWHEKTDPASGKTYYYNSTTEVSQWERPNEIEKDNKAEWQEVTDPASGKMYYYNSVTGVSQWENPNKIEKPKHSQMTSDSADKRMATNEYDPRVLDEPMTVYVGKIASCLKPSWIEDILLYFGKGTWQRVTDPLTNQPKSFGFFHYSTTWSAMKACVVLNGLCLKGKELVVSVAKKEKELIGRILEAQAKLPTTIIGYHGLPIRLAAEKCQSYLMKGYCPLAQMCPKTHPLPKSQMDAYYSKLRHEIDVEHHLTTLKARFADAFSFGVDDAELEEKLSNDEDFEFKKQQLSYEIQSMRDRWDEHKRLEATMMGRKMKESYEKVHQKLFLGNLPQDERLTENMLKEFLGAAMQQVGLTLGEGNPITSVRILGSYGFVSLRSVQETNLLLNLHEIPFKRRSIQIRRPNSYPDQSEDFLDWDRTLALHKAGTLKSHLGIDSAPETITGKADFVVPHDLPIRPGQRECPFFKTFNKCLDGKDCVYTHPPAKTRQQDAKELDVLKTKIDDLKQAVNMETGTNSSTTVDLLRELSELRDSTQHLENQLSGPRVTTAQNGPSNKRKEPHHQAEQSKDSKRLKTEDMEFEIEYLDREVSYIEMKKQSVWILQERHRIDLIREKEEAAALMKIQDDLPKSWRLENPVLSSKFIRPFAGSKYIKMDCPERHGLIGALAKDGNICCSSCTLLQLGNPLGPVKLAAGSFVLSCNKCNLHACGFCYSSSLKQVQCPGKHELTAFFTDSKLFVCSLCVLNKEKIPRARKGILMFTCTDCQFNICIHCYNSSMMQVAKEKETVMKLRMESGSVQGDEGAKYMEEAVARYNNKPAALDWEMVHLCSNLIILFVMKGPELQASKIIENYAQIFSRELLDKKYTRQQSMRNFILDNFGHAFQEDANTRTICLKAPFNFRANTSVDAGRNQHTAKDLSAREQGQVVKIKDHYGFIRYFEQDRGNIYFKLSEAPGVVKVGSMVEFSVCRAGGIGPSADRPVAVGLKLLPTNRQVMAPQLLPQSNSLAPLVTNMEPPAHAPQLLPQSNTLAPLVTNMAPPAHCAQKPETLLMIEKIQEEENLKHLEKMQREENLRELERKKLEEKQQEEYLREMQRKQIEENMKEMERKKEEEERLMHQKSLPKSIEEAIATSQAFAKNSGVKKKEPPKVDPEANKALEMEKEMAYKKDLEEAIAVSKALAVPKTEEEKRAEREKRKAQEEHQKLHEERKQRLYQRRQERIRLQRLKTLQQLERNRQKISGILKGGNSEKGQGGSNSKEGIQETFAAQLHCMQQCELWHVSSNHTLCDHCNVKVPKLMDIGACHSCGYMYCILCMMKATEGQRTQTSYNDQVACLKNHMEEHDQIRDRSALCDLCSRKILRGLRSVFCRKCSYLFCDNCFHDPPEVKTTSEDGKSSKAASSIAMNSSKPGMQPVDLTQEQLKARDEMLEKSFHKTIESIRSEAEAVEQAGLPLRPGEPDCPFFITLRKCKYGESCVYNHAPPKVRAPELVTILRIIMNMLKKCTGGSLCVNGHAGIGKRSTVGKALEMVEKELSRGCWDGLPELVLCKVKWAIQEVHQRRDTFYRTLFSKLFKGYSSASSSELSQALGERFMPEADHQRSSIYCVILDDMDSVFDEDPDVIQELFSWADAPNSVFIIVGISDALNFQTKFTREVNTNGETVMFLPDGASIKAIKESDRQTSQVLAATGAGSLGSASNMVQRPTDQQPQQPSNDPETGPVSVSSKRVCWIFQKKGSCAFGDTCKGSHAQPS